MKNPLDKIIHFHIKDKTYIIGFQFKFGLILFFELSLIHPIMVRYILPLFIKRNYFDGPITLFGIESLVLLIVSLFVMSFAIGFRITVSKKWITISETFLFVPYKRIQVQINNAVFHKPTDYIHPDKLDNVYIFKEDDPFREMGFEYWVEVIYKQKELTLGDNNNYQILYDTIQKAVVKKLGNKQL